VKPKPSMRGTCHIDISDEDKQKMTVLSDEFDPDESNEKTVEIINDSSEDEEEEVPKVEVPKVEVPKVEVPQTVPVPVPVVEDVKVEESTPTKKKIVKKATK